MCPSLRFELRFEDTHTQTKAQETSLFQLGIFDGDELEEGECDHIEDAVGTTRTSNIALPKKGVNRGRLVAVLP